MIQLPQRYTGTVSADMIREVLYYIRHYKGKAFVMKIDDMLFEDRFFPLLMKDIVNLHETGIKLIIVIGARATIEKYLKKAGISSNVYEGIRITTKQAMEHIKIAAMEVAQTIISYLSIRNVNPITGNWIRGRSLGVLNGLDYQYTGQVDKIQSDIIYKLLDNKFIPVVYNIGINATGDFYNLNTDEVACQISMDMNIEKLFFIRGQEAIPTVGIEFPAGSQVHANGKIFSNLNLDHVDELLKDSDKLNLEDKTLLTHARQVIKHSKKGVKRVHILDGRQEGSLIQEIFSSMGGGTLIYGNQHAHIRQATLEDISAILHLMDSYIRSGNLVMRTVSDIREKINSYYIYAVDHAIYGCGALYEVGDGWAEIEAVAVNEAYKSQGIGRGIVQYLIQIARVKGLHTIFLLTTQAADWFFEFGFVWTCPSALPESRLYTYNKDRNSRVLILKI